MRDLSKSECTHVSGGYDVNFNDVVIGAALLGGVLSTYAVNYFLSGCITPIGVAAGGIGCGIVGSYVGAPISCGVVGLLIGYKYSEIAFYIGAFSIGALLSATGVYYVTDQTP